MITKRFRQMQRFRVCGIPAGIKPTVQTRQDEAGGTGSGDPFSPVLLFYINFYLDTPVIYGIGRGASGDFPVFQGGKTQTQLFIAGAVRELGTQVPGPFPDKIRGYNSLSIILSSYPCGSLWI